MLVLRGWIVKSLDWVFRVFVRRGLGEKSGFLVVSKAVGEDVKAAAGDDSDLMQGGVAAAGCCLVLRSAVCLFEVAGL